MATSFTLEAIAAHCNAVVQGDTQRLVSVVAPIDQAHEQSISFISNPKYLAHLQDTKAGAIILPPDLADKYHGDCLIHANPYLAYAKTVGLLYPSPSFPEQIANTAMIADDVSIAAGCFIGEHVVIEAGTQLASGVVIEANTVIGRHVKIGQNTHVHANVSMADATEVGAGCIIHSGVVLGADGFGFAPDEHNHWHKIPQVGYIKVGDHVEIGANTCIDRAALGVTQIGNGVKLDNLIQVGHNTSIGDHTAVAACTAIAGSTEIGKHCRIAGMCAIAGHISIADHVTVTACTMVTHPIKKAGVYSAGTTAKENVVWRKNAVRFHQLDNMARRLAEVEKQLASLQTKE